jgi:hypothetical protein
VLWLTLLTRGVWRASWSAGTPIAYNGQPGWALFTGVGHIMTQAAGGQPPYNKRGRQQNCAQGDVITVRVDTDRGQIEFFKVPWLYLCMLLSVTVSVCVTARPSVPGDWQEHCARSHRPCQACGVAGHDAARQVAVQ